MIAMVTGASRGIGLEVSSKLASTGCFVIGTCKNYSAEINDVFLTKVGGNGALYCLDMTDAEAVSKFFNEIFMAHGAPSILINNAGITKDAFFHKMKSDEWNDVIDTNFKSLFNITQPIYIEMIKNKFGRIVNISSVNALKGQAGQVNYCATKAAVHGFTKALSLEGARNNITVNTVSPGYTETKMITDIREDIRQTIKDSIPMKRFAEPNEIASAVAYLVSTEASYITGTNLSINGGMRLD